MTDHTPQTTARRWKLPWEVVANMKARPDPSVPKGTILVNPDDYRAWQERKVETHGR